ncbi:MAG: hypothetical protein Q9167_007957, partial [Letrouitia subvulpina]
MEINPDAVAIAASLDEERSNGRVRGPLHGIPFLIKDNIASKDKMETTAGSSALLGSIVPRDAYVLAQLRNVGALLLGHATLSEWADMRSNEYSEGYSARGYQSLLRFLRISIMFFNSADFLVRRTSENVVPESEHQDTVGTFARTVRDAAYALDAIYGIDPRDNYTIAQEGKTPVGGYTQFLTDYQALEDAKFGLPWDSFWVHADKEMQAALLELIDLIKEAGATIINGTELPSYRTIVSPDGWDWDYGSSRGYPNESEYTVVKVDFYNNIRTYLAELENTNIRSLEDIVQYNEDNSGTEGGYPGVSPAFASGIKNATYYQALTFIQQTTRENGLDAALKHGKERLSALLVPSDVGQTYQIAAQAGYPIITLPASLSSTTSMPFGLGLMNTAWSESELIRYASAIEDLQFKS